MEVRTITSLRWKLVGAFGVVISLVVLLQVIYFSRAQTKQATEALKHKAQALTALISHDIGAAYEFGDANAVKEVFRGVEGDPDVAFLVLLDKDGKSFADLRGARAPREMVKKGPNSEVDSGELIMLTRAVTTQGGTTGTMVAGFNRTAIDAENRRNRWVATILAVIMLVPGLIITWFIATFIVRRIDRLGALAETVASGDLTVTGDETEKAKGGDEMSRLSQIFQRMAENLRATIGKVMSAERALTAVSARVGSSSDNVLSSADDQRNVVEKAYSTIEQFNHAVQTISANVEAVSKMTEEISSSILEMASSLDEIAQNTDRSLDNVDDTATAAREMVAAIREVDGNVVHLRNFVTDTSTSMVQIDASIHQVVENASRSYELALAVGKAAEAGRASVEQTINSMAKSKSSVVEVTNRVSTLGARSKEIGQILDVINDIAQQTNLLALNAAILAAQAGEHGAGFSVVADEIRALSDRTASSTKQIAQLVRGVQGEVAEAVAASEAGSAVVEDAVRLSRAAGAELDRILDAANKSTSMGREIVDAMQEQARGSKGVSMSVERLHDMVTEISTATGQQATGSDHILRATDTMRDLSEHVAHATKEQKKASERIAEVTEETAAKIEEIRKATQSQVDESQRIVQTMERIRAIAEGNGANSTELKQTVGTLSKALQELREEIGRFRTQ